VTKAPSLVELLSEKAKEMKNSQKSKSKDQKLLAKLS
jgi:hypothetical protein